MDSTTGANVRRGDAERTIDAEGNVDFFLDFVLILLSCESGKLTEGIPAVRMGDHERRTFVEDGGG